MQTIKMSALMVVAGMMVSGSAMAGQIVNIAVWNFNDSNLVVDHGAGTMTTDVTTYNWAAGGTTLNAVSGDSAGNRLQAPPQYSGTNQAGRFLQWDLDLSGGLYDLVMSLASYRNTGYTGNHSIQYRVGSSGTFSEVDSFTLSTSWAVYTADFSGVEAVNGQPLVQVRWVLPTASDWNGGLYYDNIQFNAAIPEPASAVLLGLTGLTIMRRRGRRA